MYGLQHGVLAHTEQQAIKGPKITSVKPFKRENQRSCLYKKREFTFCRPRYKGCAVRDTSHILIKCK